MTYTREDIETLDDDLAFIRRHPQMFVGRVSGEELAGIIAEGAILLTGKPARVGPAGDWWLIASEADWLNRKEDAEEWFYHLRAFPEAGDNSIHGEVLLTAFADAVLTLTRSHQQVIKGTAAPADEIRKWREDNHNCRRIIAFRLD